MTDELRRRTPEEVFDDHLRLAGVRDGADSFVIENGWIVAQTIHYTVEDGHGPDPQ